MSEHTDFLVAGIMIPKSRVVIAEQTHSNHVHICTEEDCGAGFDEHPQIADCDALVTNLPEQFLFIRTADCTPLLLYDEVTQSIGAVHSGREGTRKNVVAAAVKAMQDNYSALPENIKAWVGAGICKRHYQVSEDIWSEFFQSCKSQNISMFLADFPHLDIHGVVLQQLKNAGLKAENIDVISVCTFESEIHFSYRRDGTNNRQINIIGMKYGKHNL